MHKSRIAILIVSSLGMISTLFIWKLHDSAAEFGLAGFLKNPELEAITGLDSKYGYVTVVLFAIVLLIAVIGKRESIIPAGTIKFTLLLINGSLVIYHIIVISLFMFTKFNEPAYGVYTAFVISLASLLIPYLFKASGKIAVMTPKEIKKDIEKSAEDFEDKMDDIGDQIEDNVEEVFKKKSKEEE
jgi:hypothetical protein